VDRKVKGMIMNQLISDLARAEIDERIRIVERERSARLAVSRRPRRPGRISSAAQALRVSFSHWRARTQLGALSVPMCSEGCTDPFVR